MWIARDKDDSLWLFNEKPVRNEEESYWTISSPNHEAVGTLRYTMFPELKWEDEPIEVDLLPKGKTNKTDITVTRENIIFNNSYWTALRNTTAMAAMQSIIETCENISFTSIQEKIAETAIDCADILIEKLKSKEVK